MKKNNMEQYMDTLLSQIREKRARELVRREIEGHITEQKETYLEDGMTEQKAEIAAVADMGDPVETGAALDRIHRPKPAWGMLTVIAVLCMAGILLQYFISVYGLNGMSSKYYFFRRQCLHAVIGFLLLCGIYLLDYTRIAACSRWLCKIILLFLIIAVNKEPSPAYAVFIESLLYLYVPLFGAMLYTYRTSLHQFWMILLYTILPLLLALKSHRVILCLNLTVIFLIMLAMAAFRGWFRLSRKIPRPAALAAIIGCPLLIAWPLCTSLSYSSYQLGRIRAWLDSSFGRSDVGYIGGQIHEILSGSQLIGPNTQYSIEGNLPSVSTNFILTFLIGCFGILAGFILILSVVVFAVRLLRISIHQKNQLGMMMGLGCSLVFGIQSAEYILINLGLLPVSGAYFPLISYGGNSMMHTCILLGILLSIYRYQDVVSDPVL